MIGSATRLAPRLCPHCGHFIDAASGVTGNFKPKWGDYTVCIRCAGIMVFDRRLHAVKPKPGQLERDCRRDTDLAKTLEGAQALVRLVPWPEDKTSRT